MRRAGLFASAAALTLLCLAGAAGDARSEDVVSGYVGDEVCSSCHEDLIGPYSHTIHAKVLTEQNARTEAMRYGCESCHGPGGAHVEAGGGRGQGGPDWIAFSDEDPPAEQDAVCLGCHQGGKQLHWAGSPHQMRGQSCTSCHNVMRKVSPDAQLTRSNVVDTCAECHPLRRSQTFRNAHMPSRVGALEEGWMDCASCHNPHGTVTPNLLDALSPNDTCYSCHADKRGPFLWEHPPVTENCMNCHDPHGTITDSMLRMPQPQLCQTCHVASRHPSNPYGPTDPQAFGRACLHCHQNIHGSNHPSGVGLTR